MISRAPSLALPLAFLVGALAGCPVDVDGPGEGEGEGEGEGDAGEGEGEGDGGEGEGEGEGECAVDACPDVGARTAQVAFSFPGGGAKPTVSVDGGAAITVASSTRGDVEAILGAGAAADDLSFRIRYCDLGVEVQYVDVDGTFDDSGPAAGNVVSRVVTLADALASGGGYTVGAAAPAAGGLFVHPADAQAGEGEVRFGADAGFEAVVDGAGTVVGLVAFKPQGDDDNWGLAIDLTTDGGAVGAVQVNGSDFEDVTSEFGSAFDAQGEVDVGFLTVQVRIYAAYGLRFAGVCQGGCDQTTSVQSITLSPPFLGREGSVGIGASRADLEALLGVAGSAPDANNIVTYGDTGLGSSPLGVGYVQDGTCTERAAAFVMGYLPP